MSHIWVPKLKIVEPKRELIVASRACGRYKLEAVRPDGRRRPLTSWFSNLVLDAGLNLIGTTGTSNALMWMQSCRVGTGNTPPTAADQNLASHLAGTSTTVADTTENSGAPDYYARRVVTFQFAQGAAAGNIAEVGVGTQTTNGNNLFSRELVRDEEGMPITVTVQPDEFLEVTYEHRHYPASLADVEDTITIGQTMYDIVARPALVGNSGNWGCPYSFLGAATFATNGALGAVTGQPSGTQSGASSTSAGTYTSGNFYRDFTATWNLSTGNLSGGISAIFMRFGGFVPNPLGGGAVQISFSPAIPKTASQVLSLVVRRSWGRRSI